MHPVDQLMLEGKVLLDKLYIYIYIHAARLCKLHQRGLGSRVQGNFWFGHLAMYMIFNFQYVFVFLNDVKI